VVLYEMLTAQRLFKGEDLGETLASVVKEKPDFSAIPSKARRLLEACLQKDPRHRLQAIGDRHLLLAEPEKVVVEARTEPKRSTWLWPALAGVLAVGAAALAWTHFRETPPLVQSLRYQLTRDGRFVDFSLSPDGHYLAFISTQKIIVRAMDSLEERELPGTVGATFPFWSPDSAHIAFFAQGKLKQLALSGGPATNIADAADARGGTWGSDGTIVFAPTVNGGLSKVSPANGGPAVPLQLPFAKGKSLRFPSFLSDSNRFSYVATSQGATPEEDGLYVGSLDGTPPVRVLPDPSVGRFVQGHLIFAREQTLMAQPFDLDSLTTSGEAFPLADSVTFTGSVGNTAFAVSADGTLLYEANSEGSLQREVVWLDRNGRRGKTLVKRKGLSTWSLSPDETHVAYVVASAREGDIWLHEVAHGTDQRFTLGPFTAFRPEWSSDSSAVVFTVVGSSEGYLKSTKVSAKEENLKIKGTNLAVSSWQADGKLLAYSIAGDTTRDDLWLLPLEGDRTPRVFKQTPFAEHSAEISPDGRWMVYSSDASGQFEVYIEPIPSGGAQRQISLGGGRSPAWRKDGRELYFLAGNKLMAVEVQPGPNLTFGTPHELFSAPFVVDVRTQSVYPNADGSQFLALLPVGDAPAAPPLTVVTNWLHAYGK
jgi:Tol biopolymer transport system component